MSIVGFTGPLAGGKSTLADRLMQKGYVYVSLSDEVRKEAARRGLPMIREVLQDVGDSLRVKFGNEVLAQRIGILIDEVREQGQTEKIVVDGLRNPGEINWLKEYFGMHVVGVVADPNIRFERMLKRAGASDPVTREDFDKVESRDRGVGQAEYGNQTDACLALADTIIENNGTLEELDVSLREALISLGIEGAPRFKEGR